MLSQRGQGEGDPWGSGIKHIWSSLGWKFDNCTMLQGTHGGKFDVAAIKESAENLEN